MSEFERQWQGRFERYAVRHRAEHRVSGWSEVGLRRRIDVFNDLVDAGLLPDRGRVLDVGCGAGTYVRLMAKRNREVVGLDYSRPSLCRAIDADPGGGGRYVGGEAYALPFADQSFGAVISIGVFQALVSPARALSEMARVLVAGGILLIETLNPWSPPATLRRLRARLQRVAPHLLYYPPRTIDRMLAENGVRPLRRVPILLPPRSLPALGTVFDSPWLRAALEALPAAGHVMPHAFWSIGERVR